MTSSITPIAPLPLPLLRALEALAQTGGYRDPKKVLRERAANPEPSKPKPAHWWLR